MTFFWYKSLYLWRRLLSAMQPISIDHLEDGIVILDKAHYVVDMNAVAEQMLGQTAVSLIGQSLTALWPEQADQLEQAAGNDVEIVAQNMVPTRTYALRLKALPRCQKSPHSHMLILHDVTEQKDMENMRRDLTHTMVHDLRAPLSNSMFALQMLQTHLHGQTTPEAARMIGMTISNTEKILERVNQILDIERLDAQQMPLAFSAVSLPDVIETVLEVQASRIAEKELDMNVYVPNSLAYVWADAGLLERVLQNLVDNSIKFTPVAGEIVIEATAVAQSDPAAIHVSISDTGTGIPQHLQDIIFDKFAGAMIKGSSGLGLAFCKMTLLAHGQNIWVESQPGQGSVFTFSLALAGQPQNRLASPIPA